MLEKQIDQWSFLLDGHKYIAFASPYNFTCENISGTEENTYDFSEVIDMQDVYDNFLWGHFEIQ